MGAFGLYIAETASFGRPNSTFRRPKSPHRARYGNPTMPHSRAANEGLTCGAHVSRTTNERPPCVRPCSPASTRVDQQRVPSRVASHDVANRWLPRGLTHVRPCPS